MLAVLRDSCVWAAAYHAARPHAAVPEDCEHAKPAEHARTTHTAVHAAGCRLVSSSSSSSSCLPVGAAGGHDDVHACTQETASDKAALAAQLADVQAMASSATEQLQAASQQLSAAEADA